MVLTLPPDDDSRGRPHGHFEVTLSAPVWTAAVTDEATHAHIRFWGHCRSHEQVIAVPEEQAKAFSTVPITVDPAKFMSYLKEVHALRIIFRYGSEDVASSTFPMVQIGPSEFNLNQEGTIPLLCSKSSQCIGHVCLMVKIAFPDIDAFQELECHVANSAPDFRCVATTENTQPSDGVQQDAVDCDTDALLQRLFEQRRSKKGQPKEEDSDAASADIFSLVYAVCVRRPSSLKKAFSLCDQNKSGQLDTEDLGRVVEEILPFVPSEEQLSFFRLMLDATGASEFALHDVQTAVRECRDITKSIRNPADGKSGEVLHAFAASLQQRSLELGKQFRSLDVGCKGELPIATVLDIVQELTCSPPSIRRYVVAKQHSICGKQLDLLSLEDVRQMCRHIVEEHACKVHASLVGVGKSVSRQYGVDTVAEGGRLLCGGKSPARGDADGDTGSVQLTPQSSNIAECTPTCPASLTSQHTRRACHARESLEQFEAQYSEIQQMLAQTRTTADRRRSDVSIRTPLQHSMHHDALPATQILVEDRVKDLGMAAHASAQPSHGVEQQQQGASDCDSAPFLGQGQGSIDIDQAADCLLAQALTLRGLVAELSASVSRSTQTSQVGQCASVTAGTTGVAEVGIPAQLSDGQSQTGHSRAQDAVELASMKALATSPLHPSQPHPTGAALETSGAQHAVHPCESGENTGILGNLPEEDVNLSASSEKGCNVSGANTRSQIVYSPVSDDMDVDALGALRVTRVQGVVLPNSAQAMLDGGDKLGIWMAWRMPGLISTRPCMHLMAVNASDVVANQSGSLAVGERQVNVWAEVPLALSRMRSAATLGQPACLQCELWLLAGKDATFALSQSNLSLLIGLCSIPLQFSPPDNGAVMLCQDSYTLPNVLEGWDGAKIEVQLTAGEDAAPDLEHILPKRSHPQAGVAAMAEPGETLPEENVQGNHGQGGAVTVQQSPDLIQHAFEVHMLSMNDLSMPSPKRTMPVARYLKYSFPCDSQALYTQDVPVQACTEFEEATFAQHKISLPHGTTILEHLRQQSPEHCDEPSLSFEVYDCYDDGDEGEDEVCLLGRLPLKSLLQSMESEVVNWETESRISRRSESSLSCWRSFIVQLTDATAGPQVLKSDAKPYISVKMAYSAT